MTRHVLDPDRVTEREQRSAADAAEFDDALHWLVAGPRGQVIVQWLFRLTGVLSPSFNPNALEMARASSRRELGLEILSELRRVSPAKAAELLMKP
jgi:hypothetical protein